jgi:hypothetical protein
MRLRIQIRAIQFRKINRETRYLLLKRISSIGRFWQPVTRRHRKSRNQNPSPKKRNTRRNQTYDPTKAKIPQYILNLSFETCSLIANKYIHKRTPTTTTKCLLILQKLFHYCVCQLVYPPSRSTKPTPPISSRKPPQTSTTILQLFKSPNQAETSPGILSFSCFATFLL